MIYCFDLDGTLCSLTKSEYDKAEPIIERINIVNKLYDDGNTIIIDTARGAQTKIDWYDVTKNQLDSWGVKYHELRVGKKLHYDKLIDDKANSDKSFFDDLTAGEIIDDKISNFVDSILKDDKFPNYDDIHTDTFSELIDKLCIVHIRYWYLEDEMAICKDDERLVELRKKSEYLFKEKRPMLVLAIDKYIDALVKNKINYTPQNIKKYLGWEN